RRPDRIPRGLRADGRAHAAAPPRRAGRHHPADPHLPSSPHLPASPHLLTSPRTLQDHPRKGTTMRKIIVSAFMTLDGVIEKPGELGWAFKFDRGPEGNAVKMDEISEAGALLLGRTTYEGFAQAWPQQTGEFADKMNGMPKYVVSGTLKDPRWENTTVIALDDVAELKRQPGDDILVNGSAKLVQALAERGLVDEYRLMVYPILLGGGQRLFGDDAEEAALELVTAEPVGSDGVMMLTYRPRHRTVTSADGTSIAYDRVGAGPAVVLVQGAFSTAASSRCPAVPPAAGSPTPLPRTAARSPAPAGSSHRTCAAGTTRGSRPCGPRCAGGSRSACSSDAGRRRPAPRPRARKSRPPAPPNDPPNRPPRWEIAASRRARPHRSRPRRAPITLLTCAEAEPRPGGGAGALAAPGRRPVGHGRRSEDAGPPRHGGRSEVVRWVGSRHVSDPARGAGRPRGDRPQAAITPGHGGAGGDRVARHAARGRDGRRGLRQAADRHRRLVERDHAL